jgi:hypothetical protein
MMAAFLAHEGRLDEAEATRWAAKYDLGRQEADPR